MFAERLPARVPWSAGLPRSPGVHVSSIIRLVAAEYGLLKKEWVEDLSLVEVAGQSEKWWNKLDLVAQLRMGMGLAWEQWYLPQVPGVVHQPGEMHVDGIFMTHDGESLDVIKGVLGPRHTLVCHEVKVTYKSVNTVGDIGGTYKGVHPDWMWLTQIKAYCKGLGCVDAILHILYPCGDYTWPMQPDLHIWRLRFEQREIDESWEFLVDYLRKARAEYETPLFGGV